MKLHDLLQHMVRIGASDLHISPDMPPLLRQDGILLPAPGAPVLKAKDILALMQSTINVETIESARKGIATTIALPLQTSTGEMKARFRINVFPCIRGISCAFRLIPARPPRLTELGLPEIVTRLTQERNGLVLIVGTTGAGKSTTLAASMEEINQTLQHHIITLEDPIEYVFQSARSLVQQREIGVHVSSFTEGLTDALREDPDVIMVGEMRKAESISLALLAAETGHLVYSTLHAGSAAKTIERLIAAVAPEERDSMRMLLSETLKGIVLQKLIPKKDGGRAVATEVLLNTTAVANMIREGKTQTLYSTIQSGKQYGMHTLTDSLVQLIRSGTVTLQDAEPFASDVPELHKAVRARG